MKSGISEMHTHVHINYGKEEKNVINKTLSLLSPRHSKWDYSVLRGPRSPPEGDTQRGCAGEPADAGGKANPSLSSCD